MQIKFNEFLVPLMDDELSINPCYVCISVKGNPTLISLLAMEIKNKTTRRSLMYSVELESRFIISFNCMEALEGEIRFYINRWKRSNELVSYRRYLTNNLGEVDYVMCQIDRSYCYIFTSNKSSTYAKYPVDKFSKRSEFIHELNKAINYERSKLK